MTDLLEELIAPYVKNDDRTKENKSAKHLKPKRKTRGKATESLAKSSYGPKKPEVQKSAKNTKPFITAQELAEHWAMSPIKIRKLAREGQIPVLRVGGSIRFDSKLLSQKPTPVDE